MLLLMNYDMMRNILFKSFSSFSSLDFRSSTLRTLLARLKFDRFTDMRTRGNLGPLDSLLTNVSLD